MLHWFIYIYHASWNVWPRNVYETNYFLVSYYIKIIFIDNINFLIGIINKGTICDYLVELSLL